MPHTATVTLYRIDELESSARERARADYRHHWIDNDQNWYEPVFEHFTRIAAALGLTVADLRPASTATTGAAAPAIYFSGFSHQGDGASFAGDYRANAHAARALAEAAPGDDRLAEIGRTLHTIATSDPRRTLCARIRQRGHYVHEHTMYIEAWREGDEDDQDLDVTDEEALTEAFRNLARWLYGALYDAYEQVSCDEQVESALREHRFSFTSDGRHFALPQTRIHPETTPAQ